MLNITISENKNDICLRFKGHANYKSYGSDIVCASVSMLYHILIKGVFNINPCAIRCQNDNVYVDMSDQRISSIVMTIILGLSDVAQNYPNNVTIIKESKNEFFYIK